MIKKLWESPTAFCAVASFILTLYIESASRHDLFGGIKFFFAHPMFYIINCLIIALPLSFSYLFKKRASFQFVVSFIFFVLGTVNCILLFTRITPFEAVDLSILRTGISIVRVYLNLFEIILIAVGIIVALVGAVYLIIKLPKCVKHIKAAIVCILVYAVLCSSTVFLASTTGSIPQTFSDMNEAYETYGFTYCFIRSIFDRGIPEPKNYSEYTIDEILSNIGSAETEKPKSKPNIIMIQLESFMDPAYFKNVTFEEDPVPCYRKLKEQGISGHLYVPSVGSGTANTEFEVLCSMSLDYFGTGEYPYKTILQTRNCETICYDLAELGYTSHAFHNHTGTFYNRNTVYKNLGFNTFTPLEYMGAYEANPLGWAKDSILEDYIINAVDSTSTQDFVFAVSVQGHGKYPTEPVEGETLITAEGVDNPQILHQIEYYAYQLRETDEFLQSLVNRLSQSDEKFVLVLYGDHQPSIDYSVDDISLDSKHCSEYVIWANYPIKHESVNIESYQLSSLVLDSVGINNGILTKLHQNYCDSPDYLSALEMLEYDMLYGNMLSYKGNNEYISPDMKMGITDISISRVSVVNGAYYIVGNGFTDSSVLYINGNKQDAVLISDGVLLLQGNKVNDGDVLSVHQITNDFVDLGKSNDIIYSSSFEVKTQIDPTNIED